jgi:hypothetical protein
MAYGASIERSSGATCTTVDVMTVPWRDKRVLVESALRQFGQIGRAG